MPARFDPTVCVAPADLLVGTQSENLLDAAPRPDHPYGPGRPRADRPARSMRTIAVAQASDGTLYAGSSNGFGRGMKATAKQLGVNLVPTSRGLYAEENLLKWLNGNFDRVGTFSRAPCGPSEHDCAGQLAAVGISAG